MSEITKKSLKHLADLAKLELTEKEEEKFIKDLESILGHFQELQELDTEGVQPLTGGTLSSEGGSASGGKNVWREDGSTKSSLAAGPVVDAFPDKEEGYLKVPAVFDQ